MIIIIRLIIIIILEHVKDLNSDYVCVLCDVLYFKHYNNKHIPTSERDGIEFIWRVEAIYLNIIWCILMIESWNGN